MSVRGWTPKKVNNPRGMWSSLAAKRAGNPSRASFMQNCRINPGVVVKRPGTSAVKSVSGKVTGLFNWVTPSGTNLVLYQEGTTIKALNQSGLTTVTLNSGVSSRAPVFETLGAYAYFVGFTTTGAGTSAVRVTDGTNTDIAFRNPPTITASATVTDGGAGNGSAGLHQFGIVYQSRSGFAGRPTLLANSATMYITIDDARKINITLTLPAQTDGGGNAAIYLIQTRATNQAKWYFIPNDAPSGSVGSFAVPYNSSTTFNFVANFSDEDIASLDSADDNFSLDVYGSDSGGPCFVSVYGQRMVYGVGTRSDSLAGIGLIISKIGQPQQTFVDQDSVAFPGRRVPGFGFQLPNSPDFFVTGDRWTARLTDNGSDPINWPPCVSVSESLGSPFPGCVCAHTAGGYAWLATERGLEFFNGAFSTKPLTYLCQDQWDRVNWAAAYSIQITDSVTDQRVYCAVPLDGATECTHLFVIDYTNGTTFDTVDIGLDSLDQSFSSVAAVKQLATADTNIWFGPNAGSNITKLDSTVKDDEGNAINAYWESGLVRGTSEISSATVKVGGADIWARGSAASLPMTVYGPDHVVSVSPALLSTQGVTSALTATPGIAYMAKFFLSNIENFTYRFGTTGANEWFELSSFTAYIKPHRFNR